MNSDTWLDAANAATFPFYEMISPVSDYRWAGGYGFDEEQTRSLEVIHDQDDGTQILIDSHAIDGEGAADSTRRRLAMALVSGQIMRSSESDLKLTLAVSAVDRMLTVDGVATEFIGVSVGNVWSGVASVGPVGVRVEVSGGPSVPLALAKCTSLAMPDTGRH